MTAQKNIWIKTELIVADQYIVTVALTKMYLAFWTKNYFPIVLKATDLCEIISTQNTISSGMGGNTSIDSKY